MKLFSHKVVMIVLNYTSTCQSSPGCLLLPVSLYSNDYIMFPLHAIVTSMGL